MSIVTKTGDKGTTGLFGGKRVSKSDPRLHAYGTIDELNAVLGLVLAEKNVAAELHEQLLQTQRLLFRLGADLATPVESKAKVLRMNEENVREIEKWIAALETELPMLTRFILPSGSRSGSLLHFARTVCRRAERHVVELSERESISTQAQIYLNRLSDYLFLAARKVNRDAGAEEVEV